MRAQVGGLQVDVGTVGTIGFALALAFLLLGGARELLRFSRESVVFAGLAAAAIMLARTRSPLAATAVGLFAVAALSLVHAAAASSRRIMPGPRGRVLIVLLIALGMCGAAVAVLSALELEVVVSALS